MQTLASALNKPLRLIEVPAAGARAGMLESGMSEQLADAILELTSPGHTIDELVTTTVADVTGKPARTYEAWAKDHATAFA